MDAMSGRIPRPGTVLGGVPDGRQNRTWQFSKTKLCKFEIIGMCAKGHQCPFAHGREEMKPLPDLTCTKLCKTLIQTGSCENRACKYAHSKEELRATSTFHKTKLCRFAQIGHCALGSKCNFAHSAAEIRKVEAEMDSAELALQQVLAFQEQMALGQRQGLGLAGQLRSYGLDPQGQGRDAVGREPGLAGPCGRALDGGGRAGPGAPAALAEPGGRPCGAGSGMSPPMGPCAPPPYAQLQAAGYVAQPAPVSPTGADCFRDGPAYVTQMASDFVVKNTFLELGSTGGPLRPIRSAAGRLDLLGGEDGDEFVGAGPCATGGAQALGAAGGGGSDPSVLAGGDGVQCAAEIQPQRRHLLGDFGTPAGSGVGCSPPAQSAPQDGRKTGFADAPAGPGWDGPLFKDGGGSFLVDQKDEIWQVKNTFLTFSPQVKPIRSVRTAEGALCTLGTLDVDGEEEL